MRRWLIWLPFVAFAGVLWVAADALPGPAQRSQRIDRALPRFALRPMLPDKPGVESATSGGGKPRLLNIFASWCVPCIAEAPQLLALQRAGVRIDAIAVRDRPDAVRRFLNVNGDPYAGIGDDRRGSIQRAFGSSGVPETWLIDGRGRVIGQHAGDIRADEVQGIVAAVKAAR